LTANQVAGSYQLTAESSSGTSVAFNLTNLPGAVSGLTISGGDSQTSIVGKSFPQTLRVIAQDSFGNKVPNATVQFTVPTSGASAKFSTLSVVTTSSSGEAVSPSFTANTVSGSYSIIAKAGNQVAALFSMTNLADIATKLLIIGGNTQTAVVNATYAQPLQLKLVDNYGNPVPNQSISFATVNTGPGVAFNSAAAVITNAMGVATSPLMTANTIAGSFIVTASASNNLKGTFSLTNSPGAAAKATIVSGTNQSATVNTAFISSLKVSVTDLYNNVLTNVPVTFTIPAAGPGIVLNGSNVITTVNGLAELTPVVANKITGSYNVIASVPNLQPLNFALTNNVGSPATISVLSGSNQSAVINNSYATPMQVKVVDSFGNLVHNANVQFNAPTTGASLKFNGLNTALTNSSGIATSSSFLANGSTGTFTVTASIAGAMSAAFRFTNSIPTIQAIVVQQGAAQRSFIQYIDIQLNDPTTASALTTSTNRVRLTNTGLDGKSSKAIALTGLMSVSGSKISVKFGANGLGGSINSNAADGSYLIEMDLDGNGTFETTARFHRLLGDVNGDKVVDINDTNLVKVNLNKTGVNIQGDSNGDGKVNSTDSTNVSKAQKRKVLI